MFSSSAGRALSHLGDVQAFPSWGGDLRDDGLGLASLAFEVNHHGGDCSGALLGIRPFVEEGSPVGAEPLHGPDVSVHRFPVVPFHPRTSAGVWLPGPYRYVQIDQAGGHIWSRAELPHSLGAKAVL